MSTSNHRHTPWSKRNRKQRCTGCGHRYPDDWVPATRTLPPWYWPVELIDRKRAKNEGKKKR